MERVCFTLCSLQFAFCVWFEISPAGFCLFHEFGSDRNMYRSPVGIYYILDSCKLRHRCQLLCRVQTRRRMISCRLLQNRKSRSQLYSSSKRRDPGSRNRGLQISQPRGRADEDARGRCRSASCTGGHRSTSRMVNPIPEGIALPWRRRACPAASDAMGNP